MGTFHLRKGKDIKLKGAAEKRIVDQVLPKKVAIQPIDFRGLKTRLLVKVGDSVQIGTPLLEDKVIEGIRICSPASGKVTAINRGDKRLLLEVVIDTDEKQISVSSKIYNSAELKNITKKEVIAGLLSSGLWPTLRQRPFSKVAHPEDTPKSIFVHAMNTEPLAADVDFVLEGKENEFQEGLNILKTLTSNVHVCMESGASSKALSQAQNVECHQFTGPHPTGNVSTHIQNIDPLNKGDLIWYLEAQDVVRIGHLFLKGEVSSERIVALTGEGISDRYYARTVVGAPLNDLTKDGSQEFRYISGSILAGKDIGLNGFLRFYDSQITAIGGEPKRQFLGWMVPGVKKYTFSKTFVSACLPEKEVSLDVDLNGGHRAIVLNHIYDSLVSLDILVYFLIRALVAGDIEEQEMLGILECDEEDFALCTFACPSKTNIGLLVRQGLEIIEKEG